jgi:hypothetical protein
VGQLLENWGWALPSIRVNLPIPFFLYSRENASSEKSIKSGTRGDQIFSIT